MIAALLVSALALAAPAARSTRAASQAAAAARTVVPFIADDYPRAVALAKQRHLPVFIEGWAPW